MSARRSIPERDRRELEVLHRVAVALSQSLSTSEVLHALTRELVSGVERACECAISLWDEQRDLLIDAAALHGPRRRPPGRAARSRTRSSEYPATRACSQRGRGWGEYRMSDPELAQQRPRGAGAVGLEVA